MAELLKTDDVANMTVPGGQTWSSGDMRAAADGRIGIVTGCKQYAAGEVASLRLKGHVRIVAGANLSAGDVGAVHIANQNLIATAGAGVDAGTVLYTVTSGQYAILDLNEGI